LLHLNQWHDWYWGVMQLFGVKDGLHKFTNVSERAITNTISWFVRVMMIIIIMLRYDTSLCVCTESRLLTMLLFMQRSLDWSLQIVKDIVNKQKTVDHKPIIQLMQGLSSGQIFAHSCPQMPRQSSVRNWLISEQSSTPPPGVWQSILAFTDSR
jgi:hypothetical protein